MDLYDGLFKKTTTLKFKEVMHESNHPIHVSLLFECENLVFCSVAPTSLTII